MIWGEPLPAGDELAAGWGADGLDVVILKFHSISSQFIQRRCLYIRAVIANVVESLIVCHDKNNVRRLWDRRPPAKSLNRLVFHLVRSHHVPGQVPEAEQTHHGKTSQRGCGHFFCCSNGSNYLQQPLVDCHQIMVRSGKVLSLKFLVSNPELHIHPHYFSKIFQTPLKTFFFPEWSH